MPDLKTSLGISLMLLAFCGPLSYCAQNDRKAYYDAESRTEIARLEAATEELRIEAYKSCINAQGRLGEKGVCTLGVSE